jgi:SNF2-related domain
MPELHRYQHDAIDFLQAAPARQLIAIMGAGKTAIALHAITALRRDGLLNRPTLVVAPLMVAETVWHAEAKLWPAAAALVIERVIGSARQRRQALDRPADVYVTNYDNIDWLMQIVAERDLRFSVLIADEASALKNPTARRTQTMLQLGLRAERRWTMTGTPRGYQLTDVWAPAQLVTHGTAFPPFFAWRDANFFPLDLYRRNWLPRMGVEAAMVEVLRPFTHVVDRAALNTRPPAVEIVHDIPLDASASALYQALDTEGGGVTNEVFAATAAGIRPRSDMAIVGKLMQVCSGAVYDQHGTVQRIHDRRLDVLAELHAAHDRPTLVFVTFRHEITRIRARFPFACELQPHLIDAWNRGAIEMLVAHPAAAGHGINLQGGSDTLVWFSLPWSAELYAQANARLARQGQARTVNIHLLVSPDRIDRIALTVVRRRIAEQDALIAALEAD